MGLFLIPMLVSAGIIALCSLTAALGGVLLIFAESRPLGWQILRASGITLLTGLVFTWGGLFVYGILTYFVIDRIAILALWACGPVGVLFGVGWHCLREPISRRVRNGSAKRADADNSKTEY
jgi:hypothetical protein